MRFFCNNKLFIRRMILIILIIIIIILLIISRFYTKKPSVFNEENLEQFIIRKGTSEDKIISFACSVDWGNEYIDPMLDILDRYDVKITFFLTGTWASEFPGIAQRISSRGHEIGNNGYYIKSYDISSYDNVYEDLKKAHEEINKITGYDIKLFSPHSSTYNNNLIKAAIDLGYFGIVINSIDTADWKRDSTAEKVYKSVLDKIDGCDIVLIHPTKSTVNALNNIIGDLMKQNYKIMPISEMLKR